MVDNMIERLDTIADTYRLAFEGCSDVFKDIVNNAFDDAKVSWPTELDYETGYHVDDAMVDDVKRTFYEQWCQEYSPFYAMNHIEAFHESDDADAWVNLTDMQICERIIRYWSSIELQRQIDLYDPEGDRGDYEYDSWAA